MMKYMTSHGNSIDPDEVADICYLIGAVIFLLNMFFS